MRGGSLYKWREEVLKRDNYTCQKCGRTDELIAHHLKPRRQYPDLVLEVSNGTTLCAECHKKESVRHRGRGPTSGEVKVRVERPTRQRLLQVRENTNFRL